MQPAASNRQNLLGHALHQAAAVIGSAGKARHVWQCASILNSANRGTQALDSCSGIRRNSGCPELTAWRTAVLAQLAAILAAWGSLRHVQGVRMARSAWLDFNFHAHVSEMSMHAHINAIATMHAGAGPQAGVGTAVTHICARPHIQGSRWPCARLLAHCMALRRHSCC